MRWGWLPSNCTVSLAVLPMHLPKPFFISSEKKTKKTLFGIFFLLLTENFLKRFITVNMNSGPAMVLPVIFSLTLRIRIPILSLMVNLPEALIKIRMKNILQHLCYRIRLTNICPFYRFSVCHGYYNCSGPLPYISVQYLIMQPYHLSEHLFYPNYTQPEYQFQ